MPLNPRPVSRRLRPVLAISGLLLSCSAFAQHSPALDRVSLWLGGYDARSDTTLHARDQNDVLNGDLNLEKDLGFKDRDWSPRARLDVLIGDSQGFSFDYYRYNRSSSGALDRAISYDGNTYDAHANVDGRLKFDFGSAAYRWWIGKGNDTFGIGIGAGYYKVRASMRGDATVDGITQAAESSTDADAWAPLLQLGWRHAFNDHWRMYFDASGVKKNGGKLYGHIYNASLGVQWFATEHFGISAEYGINRIRLHQEHDTYRDSLNLKLDGPSVFATFRF
ncbi:hypothetical protein [Oleiagrimonas sp. C23AA]|uniref:hypothetical protein n=1 Tax=Oleiagrimonas sp. C23AA TaxID=2719047 RepID=UPI00141E9D0F|nr:hypothetical protein [Oleiagrimonas sp. C23AA]NII11705.1 hypothetical protein [Oleiagrimonas sp. C23AA]